MLLLAKGAYSFLAYPETCDFEELLKSLVMNGAEYSYILHDRDRWDSDGVSPITGEAHFKDDIKKAHYHIVAGWLDHFPDWKSFRTFARKFNAVAVSFNKCLVHDCEGCTDYFTHPDGDGFYKFKYAADDVHSSPDFDVDAYQLADKRREKSRHKKKVEDLCKFQELACIIKENELRSFGQYLDFIMENYPEYLNVSFLYDRQITKYLESWNLKYASIEDITHENKDLVHSNHELGVRIENLRNYCNALKKQNDCFRKTIVSYGMALDQKDAQLEFMRSINSDEDTFIDDFEPILGENGI